MSILPILARYIKHIDSIVILQKYKDYRSSFVCICLQTFFMKISLHSSEQNIAVKYFILLVLYSKKYRFRWMKRNLHETVCKQLQINFLSSLCIQLSIEHSTMCDSRTKLNYTVAVSRFLVIKFQVPIYLYVMYFRILPHTVMPVLVHPNHIQLIKCYT